MVTMTMSGLRISSHRLVSILVGAVRSGAVVCRKNRAEPVPGMSSVYSEV